jgi:hypothetical protein
MPGYILRQERVSCWRWGQVKCVVLFEYDILLLVNWPRFRPTPLEKHTQGLLLLAGTPIRVPSAGMVWGFRKFIDQ